MSSVEEELSRFEREADYEDSNSSIVFYGSSSSSADDASSSSLLANRSKLADVEQDVKEENDDNSTTESSASVSQKDLVFVHTNKTSHPKTLKKICVSRTLPANNCVLSLVYLNHNKNDCWPIETFLFLKF